MSSFYYIMFHITDLSRPKGETSTVHGGEYKTPEAANAHAWRQIDDMILSGIGAVKIKYKVCLGEAA